MKQTAKRLPAALLAVLTVFSALTMFGAFAAETDVTAETEAVAAPIPEEEAPTVGGQPAVGQVTGLTKTTINVNDINLVWNRVSGAAGYVVYRCSADYDKGVYRKVADVKTNTYDDTKLVQGSPYYYKVAAYIIENGVRVEGEPALYRTATQPAKVTGLTRARSSAVVELSWNRNTKATGYKILRSSPESGNKEVLYRVISGNSVTRFTDTDVTLGNIYTYNVVAIRSLYGSSTYHAPGNRMTCLAGLCAPNFTIESKFYRGFLTWKKNPYATRYNVYYSTDPNAPAYTKAGSTTGTDFMTDKLPGGKTLYFRVYPIYEKNGRLVTGTSHTKVIDVNGYIYGQKFGKTYIEINIDKQRMWYYKDGKLLVETPVVTGMRNSMDTPKGAFSIYERVTDTNLVGADYVSHVDYWMAFLGGYGIHDASWRSSYGGNIYTYDGSHGCVNTPYSAVKTIYNNSGYGTYVIIY